MRVCVVYLFIAGYGGVIKSVKKCVTIPAAKLNGNFKKVNKPLPRILRFTMLNSEC
jgi:hypothetical protein